jgi:hypothetical protein
MIAWMLGAFAGLPALAELAVCLLWKRQIPGAFRTPGPVVAGLVALRA